MIDTLPAPIIGERKFPPVLKIRGLLHRDAAFVVGSPKGDLGHLGDLLPKRGLLKVTFLFKSLLSERKDDGDMLHTSFAAHEA